MALDSFRSIFKVAELKKRILFTLALLVVYRIGGHIPTPGIDGSVLTQALGTGNIFGLLDLFAGGAFAKATIFALGIMPYISASIMFQLLGAVVPYLQRLQREGEEGRRKITQYTRYLTVLVAALQAWGTAGFLSSDAMQVDGVRAVHMDSSGFIPLTILTFTCGVIFIMWLGEQITERGIGNGISLIIFIGIIARFPEAVVSEVLMVWSGSRSPVLAIVLVVMMLGVTAAVILMTRAQRRIPVQYPKRVVGRKVFGGAATHLPLSVNSAGVIPIIFAQSIMFLPSTVAQLFPVDWLQNLVQGIMAPGEWLYSLVYALIIVFFAYFYTAIVFNPMEMANNMRKNGGYIPGIRPGKNTAQYIEKVLTRITLPGALFFAAIAVLPWVLVGKFNVGYFFGGTGLLIVVGVALDTLQQIESHLLMRHYDGFMKKGRIKGRSM